MAAGPLVQVKDESSDAELLQVNRRRSRTVELILRANIVALPILITLAVFVGAPAWWYDDSLNSRLDPPYCELYASLSFFIVCMFMVQVSHKLAAPFFFVPMFASKWGDIKEHVRIQAIADLLKVCTRVACLGFAVPVWLRFSFVRGLDLKTLNECAVVEDVVIRRCFNGMRYMLGALMMWEMCAATTKMSWDIYLHHTLLIIGGVVFPDPLLTTDWFNADGESIYFTEGFGFLLFFGATFIFVKEMFVLCYRCTPATHLRVKARLLLWAEVAHLAQAVPFFVILPVVFLSIIAAAQEELGLAPAQRIIPWITLTGLNLLELYIAFQTRSVRSHLLKKAADTEEREACAQGIALGGRGSVPGVTPQQADAIGG